ncbi:MAG: HPr family phosphocarrier protein [Polyangiaceae bacterium]|nr:HPr family phosphocarrier protein [Polyangiaceae bacterium]
MSRAVIEVEIINELGLHARAAVKLTQVAQRFPCEIVLSRDEQRANAKSVMGVLLLCGSKGTRIRVEADGERADEAVRAIDELVAARFGEAR